MPLPSPTCLWIDQTLPDSLDSACYQGAVKHYLWNTRKEKVYCENREKKLLMGIVTAIEKLLLHFLPRRAPLLGFIYIIYSKEEAFGSFALREGNIRE